MQTSSTSNFSEKMFSSLQNAQAFLCSHHTNNMALFSTTLIFSELQILALIFSHLDHIAPQSTQSDPMTSVLRQYGKGIAQR